MAKGAGAAYQKLTVPQDGLSESIQFWGQKKSQTLGKIADRKEKAKVREERKRAKLSKRLDFDPESLKAKFTGQKDFDAVTRTFSEIIVDRLSNYEVQGNEALSRGDYDEYNRISSQSKKAQASIGNYNEMVGKVEGKLTEYMKKVSEGKVNPNDNRSMIFDAVLRHNYIADVDENSNFSLLVGVDRDKDGAVSEEERKAGEAYLEGGIVEEGFEFHEVDPHSIIDGEFRAFEKVDLTSKKGLVGELANNIGLAQYDGETDAEGNPLAGGSYVMNYEGFDEEKLPQLEMMTESKLLDPETLSWVHYQATGDEKIFEDVDDATEDEIVAAKKYLIESAVNSFDTKEGMKYNWSKDASSRDRAKEKRQREKEGGNQVEAELVTDTSGQPIAGDGEMRSSGDPMFGGREFTLKTKEGKPLKGIISDKPNAEILTLKEKGGKYYATVRWDSESELLSLESGGPQTQVETLPLSTAELNRLARAFGLNNAQGLDKYLKNRSGEQTQQEGGEVKKLTAQELIKKYGSNK